MQWVMVEHRGKTTEMMNKKEVQIQKLVRTEWPPHEKWANGWCNDRKTGNVQHSVEAVTGRVTGVKSCYKLTKFSQKITWNKMASVTWISWKRNVKKKKCFENLKLMLTVSVYYINTRRFAHHEHKTDSRIVAENCCLSKIEHSIKKRGTGANTVNFLNEERCLEILVQVVTLSKFLFTFWLYLGSYYSIWLF